MQKAIHVAAGVALAAGAALPAAVQAQAWPTKPVRLFSGYTAGGPSDLIARPIAAYLSNVFGQQFVVENKPGANANLAAMEVVKAEPDGHTMLFATTSQLTINAVLYQLPFDPQKDLAPITTVALVPNVLVISASTPATDVKSLVALAKASANPFTYGSNGNGTAQHLIGTQFADMNGIPLLHIPYKGSGPLTTDLIGGQVQMSFDTVTPVLPHIKAGKLKIGRAHV